MEAFTLFELNQHIRRVIALNFEAPIWVSCEIGQIKETRGNYYLELVQKDESTNQILAQSSAAIWQQQYWFLKKKLGRLLDDLLQDGVALKLKIKVTYHERYGMKLAIEDIDSSFTLGQLEINRRNIIERLQKENKLDVNRLLSLPRAIENIAIISSATAAGLQDFISHIDENPFQYKIKHELFESPMQGANVESNVVDRLKVIKKKGGFDVIVIIRGGGSRLDLSAFDNYAIAVEIAEADVPVLVGIGHDIDQAVIDLAGHTSLKTPTAVADFIVSHNSDFEVMLNQLGQRIQMRSQYLLEKGNNKLLQFQFDIQNKPIQHIQNQYHKLDNIKSYLKQTVQFKLEQQSTFIQSIAQLVKVVHPDQVLKKGYTYTMLNGKIITDQGQIKIGDMIHTQFSKGSLESNVTNKSIK